MNISIPQLLPDQYAMTVRKGIDDAMWSDIGELSEVGGVSIKAIETNEKNLTPKQSYELSVAVNACVNAICRNIAKTSIRLFKQSGEEIVGGKLWELLQRPARGLTKRKLMWEVASWWNIAGEFAILKEGASGSITSLFPLDPTKLLIEQPRTPPKRPGDVTQWRYNWFDGTDSLIRSDQLIFEAMFNPNHPVRGLSPLVTGAVEVSAGYSLSRYNKSFFDNGSIPSHLLILPEGTSNAQRKDIERKYKDEFGNRRSNTHKVMVVAGKDARVELLDQPFQDGAFMELRKSVLQQVAMLYRVPAIEAGIYDKTRFDTAAEERKLFVESTLMPQMDVLSEGLQTQLVDPHFSFDSTAQVQKAVFTKRMDEMFGEAREMRRDSRIIVLLDPDTLPIMGAVKAAQISVAKEFRETMAMSPKEAADYFDIDVPDRPEREDIWIKREMINISKPEMNQKFMPQPKPAAGAEKKPADKPKPKKKAISRQTLRKVELIIHKLRRHTMKGLDTKEVWSLADGDKLGDGSDLAKRVVRIVRHEIKPIVLSQDRTAAKAYFNRLHGERFIST